MRDSGKKAEDPSAVAKVGDRRKERSRATRQALIAAARRVFVRDGFETARIEEIAMLAGKTRGAFYANFADKEDVFFALMEAEMDRDLEAVRVRLAAADSPEQRMEELAQHLLDVCRDKRRMLLTIEFKLYAIRHPQQQRRLAQLHAAMAVRCADLKVDQLLPELRQADSQKQRSQAALFSAVLDGLTLNRLFDPMALQEPAMLQLLRTLLTLVAHRGSQAEQSIPVAPERNAGPRARSVATRTQARKRSTPHTARTR